MAQIKIGNRGGNVTCECTDCGRWAYEGELISHSRRCDTPAAQAAGAQPTREMARRGIVAAAKQGHVRLVASDDRIHEAVCSGEITVSEAMNQDF